MRSKKILIVEDHPDCREFLKLILSRSGYLVTIAGTGLEGMEMAAITNPDLIVMDFGLPDVTGDKVISCLKADPITKGIPVITTTGYMTAEVRKRVLAAGAVTVLLKPYHIDELVDRIEGCLSSDGEALSEESGTVSHQLNA
jgi:CheY-like chemotaxis protein